MRQTVSSGSVKAFFLDREETLKKLYDISEKALTTFPEIKEIRLFGSLSRGEETGFSDVDIFIVTMSEEKNPVERIKPYFAFFSERMDIAVDMLAASDDEVENFKELLKESLLLGKN